MKLKERVKTFVRLGNQLKDYQVVDDLIKVAKNNEWFTAECINYAIKSIADNLTEENLHAWIEKYPKLKKVSSQKKIALVTAGNIPLVGFHDLLCVLISGHSLNIKISSKDKLLKAVLELLFQSNKVFETLVNIEEGQFKSFDAVIATGSDNTAKYFEYYFGKYPNIIRKNRNSIAVLDGSESEDELNGLADDILMYFGLGCRNVSKIFIPEGFDIQRVFKPLFKYKRYVDHNKFANNYTYNKSIYLMNNESFWENGFLIMKEDTGMTSPISVLYFEYYSSLEKVKERILIDKSKIQCIVAKKGWIEGSVYFGKAQQPKLWDYADNVDTMEFLLGLGN